MHRFIAAMILVVATVSVAAHAQFVTSTAEGSANADDYTVEIRSSDVADHNIVPIGNGDPEPPNMIRPSNGRVRVTEGKSTATGETSGLGTLNFQIENRTGEPANDLHFEVRNPNDVVISGIEISAPPNELVFDEDDFAPVNDDPGEWGGDAKQGTHMPDGHPAHAITLTFEKDGEPYAEERVQFNVWFTWGNFMIGDFHPDRFGPEAELHIGTVAAVDTEPKQIPPTTVPPETTEVFDVPAVTMGETFGGRFESGSFVLRPDSPFRFVINEETDVYAVDMDGAKVPGSRFAANNLRIDGQGNFVFEVSREEGDELHVGLVIENLSIEVAEDLVSGLEIRARASCAAMGGRTTDDLKGRSQPDPYLLIIVH